jgi:16S rRNA (guanine527-N7)-methyltransferase
MVGLPEALFEQRQAEGAVNGTGEQIEKAFIDAGISGLPAEAFGQFHAYLELLLRWNQRLSLTAVREPEQIVQRHFVECAFVARHLPPDIATLLDYGSGAGLPGIPIAICRPEIRVTLAEAHGKKASFLREALRVLSLEGEVYDGRVETMPAGNRFDAVTMRAVEKMDVAIPLALQRVKQYLVLLTTERSVLARGKAALELEWLEPIPVPNTRQMVLEIGRRT